MQWLNEIQAWISGAPSDPEKLRAVFVLLLGVLAFTTAVAVSLMVLGLLSPVKKRVGAVKGEAVVATGPGATDAFLQSVGGILMPKKSDDKRRGHISERLGYAGFNSPNALRLFFAFRFLGVVLLPLLVVAATLFTGQVSIENALVYALGAAAVAYILPDLWLGRKARARQNRIRRGMPDALDLLVVSTEAGLGLNAGIQRVADEIEIQHPDLADELHLVMMQTRAGMDSRAALKDLVDRTGVEDVRSFVTTLLQSLRFGTSIADSLRVFSEDMRDKRLQKAQEEAAKLSIKMLAPIGLCIFPAFMLIALGPALLTMARALVVLK